MRHIRNRSGPLRAARPAAVTPAGAAAPGGAAAGSPLAPLQRPRYGVDAPAVPAVLSATGVACCLAAARWRPGRIAMAAAGTILLAQTSVYLHTTLRGKLRIWERELGQAGLNGDERNGDPQHPVGSGTVPRGGRGHPGAAPGRAAAHRGPPVDGQEVWRAHR